MHNFFDGIERYGNHTAIIREDGTNITYCEFVKMADRFAETLETRKTVFLLCSNTLEAVTAYIGCLRKRIVPILIHAGIAPELLENLYHLYQPAYVYGKESKAASLFKKHSGTTIDCKESYILTQTADTVSYKLSEELALLLTTSGSTGSPKLVRQSYKNITSNASAIAEYLNITENDRAIMTMPMSYTYGLSIINSHLLCGASVIMTDAALMNREFWELLKAQKATTFGGVPYIYEMLKKLRFANTELPSLRYLTQAGGRLPKELQQEFNDICHKKGIELIVMYGQTEATARMSYLPWEMADQKAGSIGVAIPGGSFALWDVDGQEICVPDTVGELVYRGDNVTLGYASGYEDLRKGDERQGLLATGDMAKRDADGYYYVVGRKKRFLKIFGNRVNLDEVEGLLKKAGYECACTGSDDAMKIFTVQKGSEAEILDKLAELTHLSKKAFQVRWISEIPRNDSGKVWYAKLEQEASGHETI